MTNGHAREIRGTTVCLLGLNNLRYSITYSQQELSPVSQYSTAFVNLFATKVASPASDDATCAAFGLKRLGTLPKRDWMFDTVAPPGMSSPLTSAI
jgi:hypothetical protein